MARKFGKRNEINLNPLAYNIGLLGESGIGKSTLIKDVCEKIVGPDGYISFDIGKEDGHKAISQITSEKIEDWAKFVEVTDDIIENKDEDYKDLKVVVIDTYDQLCDLAEKETIREYNKTAKEKVKTINGAFGGFGRGLDHAIDLMLDRLWELKKVGVSFIIVAHVKKTDLTDVMTGEQYNVLTSNTTQRYFNAIKQKLDILGLAYIDREIVKEKTTKKDKDGNLIVKGKLAGESRVINFRDDTYSVDSKSRFAQIVPQISFDADEFIKAIKDAILMEQSKDGISLEDAKKKQEKARVEEERKMSEYSKTAKENKIDVERNEELKSVIQEKYFNSSSEVKDKVKEAMASHEISNFKDVSIIPTAHFEEIVKILSE